MALRYDQTVPSARFLSQHYHCLVQPFRRYQIQNVFRAEKPQKGRYREFTQCDADIFQSSDSIADAEILALFYNIFRNIGFKNIVIKINDRNILSQALAKFTSNNLNISSIIQIIDKLDKLSPAEIILEFEAKGI